MAPKAAEKKSLGEVMKNAGKKALGGGLAGALAMVVQVLALMWMRTTINYQHAKGMSTMEAISLTTAPANASEIALGKIFIPRSGGYSKI